MTCELCSFQNPKGSVTGIIIKDNKVLALKRNEEPFKGQWDLPGGYMNKDEVSEVAIRREMKEELNVEINELMFMKEVSGYGHWKGQEFPIISHFYLLDIGDQEITLNEENSEFKWISLKDLLWSEIAWDSNRAFVLWLKEKFTFDLEKVKKLTAQLDASATFNEQYLYRAVLNGFVSQIHDGGELVAMGWIFPRKTMLRKQAVIEDMIVDESQRGKGYGDRLLVELLIWAKGQGMEVVELTSGWHRKAAHGLYLKHGFKIHDTAHMLVKL